jgi:hypothetical protein
MHKKELSDELYDNWVYIRPLIENGIIDYAKHRKILAEDEIFRPQLEELVREGVLTKVGQFYKVVPGVTVVKKQIYWVGSVSEFDITNTSQYRVSQKQPEKIRKEKDDKRKSEIRQILCYYQRLEHIEAMLFHEWESSEELPHLTGKSNYNEDDYRLGLRLIRAEAIKHRHWGVKKSLVPAEVAEELVKRGWIKQSATLLTAIQRIRGFYPWEERTMPREDALKMILLLLGTMKDGCLHINELAKGNPEMRVKFYKLYGLGILVRSGCNFRFAKNPELRRILNQLPEKEAILRAG